jgi:Plasmid pRiA4b ORF-3-like protein
LTLADLHRVIQAVMHWDDVHPHVFDVAGREFGPAPDEDEVSLHWAGDDRDVTVGKALKKDSVFEYTYDFGSEHRMTITAAGETTGGPARIECLDGTGSRFDAVAINARLVEEFHGAGRAVAGAATTPEGQLVADLTLLLLLLTSFEEGKGKRVANKTLRLETLAALAADGFLVTNPHRKGVELTPAGVRHAEVLLQRVTALLKAG